jgi:hypothetical protein
MTIRKGEEWGRTVPRPDDLRLVGGDALLAEALTDGSNVPVAATAGDVHRTLGARDLSTMNQVLELPIDLLRVTLDDGTCRTACAHVLLQRTNLSGGWWRGDVVMVMNAEFVGDWHVVARGHPNDGRAESCSWGSDFGVRQRWAARRRLPSGGHVPHPLIETRSFRDRSWTFDAPMEVRLDGVGVGRTRTLDVTVDADAAVIYA